MSNVKKVSPDVQIVTKEVKVPSRLADDPRPALAGDLIASGFSIREVKDISSTTYNGVKLFDYIVEALTELRDYVLRVCAPTKHTHEKGDVLGLKEEIESAIAQSKSRESHAEKFHVHEPKDVVGLNTFVKDVVYSLGLSHDSHDHPEITSVLQEIREGLSKKASDERVQMAEARLAAYWDTLTRNGVESREALGDLSARVREVEKSIPVLPEETVEITREIQGGTSRIHVPRKCDGMKIVEVVGIALQKSGACAVSSSKNTGDTVAMDELITVEVTAPCSVRFLFKRAQ